jgi:hypothetical protein
MGLWLPQAVCRDNCWRLLEWDIAVPKAWSLAKKRVSSLMVPQVPEVVVFSRESGAACRTDDPFMLWKLSMGPNVTS